MGGRGGIGSGSGVGGKGQEAVGSRLYLAVGLSEVSVSPRSASCRPKQA